MSEVDTPCCAAHMRLLRYASGFRGRDLGVSVARDEGLISGTRHCNESEARGRDGPETYTHRALI